MLKLVEIYEPAPTWKEVERENKAFRKAISRMSDVSLKRYFDDLAQAGDYSHPAYMMAWDELCRRGIEKWNEGE